MTTNVATTVKRRLLHLAIIEVQLITLTTTAKPQQLRVNSREMTTFAASCNDREMQRPRSDKFETAQLLQFLRKILCRFMAVVVSSAFWKSLRQNLSRGIEMSCDINMSLLAHWGVETQASAFPEASEPKTGIVRTVLRRNRNRTKLHRGHPEIGKSLFVAGWCPEGPKRHLNALTTHTPLTKGVACHPLNEVGGGQKHERKKGVLNSPPFISTPNMTGRRLHRTMETIPRPPLVVYKPFCFHP